MSGKHGIALLVGMALASSLFGGTLHSEWNKVRNGGFEEGRGGTMKSWGTYPESVAAPNFAGKDLVEPHSGKACAKIAYLAKLPPGPPLQINQYHIPLDRSNCDLIAHVWLRADKSGSSISMGIHYYDANGRHVSFRNIRFNEIGETWSGFKRQLSPPGNAAEMGIAFYGSLGASIWMDDVELVAVPRMKLAKATPVIDGEIADRCWNRTSAITGFKECYGRSDNAGRVSAWAAYDDENLYVAFKIRQKTGTSPKVVADMPDSNLMTDDSANIFLSPSGSDVYHLAFNAGGVLYDSKNKNTLWNSDAKLATLIDGDHWTAEIAVPVKALSDSLSATSSWRCNIVYIDSRENLCFSWSPMYLSPVERECGYWSIAGYYNPKRFAVIELSPRIEKFLKALGTARLAELRARVARVEESTFSPRNAGKFASVQKELRTIKSGIAAAAGRGNGGLGELDSLSASLAALEDTVSKLVYSPDAEFGFKVYPVDAMTKIPKEHTRGTVKCLASIALSAARNESESFQVVVEADSRDLHDVAVSVSPLRNSAGETLATKLFLEEYVETVKPKNFIPDYVGWWPDILRPLTSFSVARGERQPVWIRIDVPGSARSGIYKGVATVVANEAVAKMPITLMVRNFSLPMPGTLPVTMGLYPNINRDWRKRTKGPPFTAGEFLEWCNFLSTYRISVKNIAREYCNEKNVNGETVMDVSSVAPTIEALSKTRYPEDAFAIYRVPTNYGRDKSSATMESVVSKLREFLNAYRSYDLKRSFLYGVDEVREDRFGKVETLYKVLRKTASGKYPIMQTVSHAPPTNLVGLVDIWCPLNRNLTKDPENFYQKRLAAGDELWMYVAMVPNPPMANFFIDESGIDHRILFWQAWDHHVTGFLYWTVNWWINIRNIKPLYPRSPIRFSKVGKVLHNNGDGILVWPGPTMMPYPSIRLEIIRDGIEDYEYLALLRREIAAAEKGKNISAKVLAAAKALLDVSPTITSSMTRFTKDPDVLRRRRNAIADMIERLVAVHHGTD